MGFWIPTQHCFLLYYILSSFSATWKSRCLTFTSPELGCPANMTWRGKSLNHSAPPNEPNGDPAEHRDPSTPRVFLSLSSPSAGYKRGQLLPLLSQNETHCADGQRKVAPYTGPSWKPTSGFNWHVCSWQTFSSFFLFFLLYTYIASRREITKSDSRVTAEAPHCTPRGLSVMCPTSSGGFNTGPIFGVLPSPTGDLLSCFSFCALNCGTP